MMQQSNQSKTTVDNLKSLAQEAGRWAVSVSGCSEVLFERNMDEAYARLIENAAEGEREAVKALLIEEHGYDPEREPFKPEPGECSLTGISKDCCPCGYHE